MELYRSAFALLQQFRTAVERYMKAMRIISAVSPEICMPAVTYSVFSLFVQQFREKMDPMQTYKYFKWIDDVSKVLCMRVCRAACAHLLPQNAALVGMMNTVWDDLTTKTVRLADCDVNAILSNLPPKLSDILGPVDLSNDELSTYRNLSLIHI